MIVEMVAQWENQKIFFILNVADEESQKLYITSKADVGINNCRKLHRKYKKFLSKTKSFALKKNINLQNPI